MLLALWGAFYRAPSQLSEAAKQAAWEAEMLRRKRATQALDALIAEEKEAEKAAEYTAMLQAEQAANLAIAHQIIEEGKAKELAIALAEEDAIKRHNEEAMLIILSYYATVN